MFENKFSIGKVTSSLSLPRFFVNDFVRWHWRRNYFSYFDFNISKLTNPHIAIVGESGGGKSNLCKLLLEKISQASIPFILLDPHNEYVESASSLGAKVYDASINSINIFDLDGLNEKERTSELTSTFKKIFRLGDVQSYILYKCIAYSYKICAQKGKTPRLSDLLFCIKIFKKHASAPERRMLEALEKRLLVIDIGHTNPTPLSTLLTSKSIFALSSLHTSEAQSVYIEGLLKKIYMMMLSLQKSPRVKLYIIIDEAEKLGEASILSRLVAEGRKYGIGIIAISQRAKALDKDLRSNASIFVSFSQHEPEELNYISNLIAGGNELNRFTEVKKAIRNLRKGNGIVLDSTHKDPRIVSFNYFSQERRDPTHAIITRCRIPTSKQNLYLELKSRGFERREMSSSIKSLLKEGTVGYHFVKYPNYQGLYYLTLPRNSPEHDISVHLLLSHLKSQGINGVVYNSSYGPDLICYHKGKKIAVEYETGLNKIEQATKMIEERKAKFSQVIVVANDTAKERYSQINGILLFGASELFASKNITSILADPKDHINAPCDPDSPGKEA